MKDALGTYKEWMDELIKVVEALQPNKIKVHPTNMREGADPCAYFFVEFKAHGGGFMWAWLDDNEENGWNCTGWQLDSGPVEGSVKAVTVRVNQWYRMYVCRYELHDGQWVLGKF